MKINKVVCICFSPTGGSRKVAMAVAEGLAELRRRMEAIGYRVVIDRGDAKRLD